MNTNQKNEYFDIIGGPNKDILFDACKYAFVKGAVIPINFDIAANYTMSKGDPNCACLKMDATDFRIMGVDNEDGSGESFNIRGYAKKEGNQFRFRGYYNTKRRQGFITFFK